jgi:hypothetical protein
MVLLENYLRCFWFSLVQTNKAVMTGADGNQMDTESFLASLHVIATQLN